MALHQAMKQADTSKDQLNSFDIQKQRERIRNLFSRVKMKSRIDKDFLDKNYFRYV